MMQDIYSNIHSGEIYFMNYENTSEIYSINDFEISLPVYKALEDTSFCGDTHVVVVVWFLKF